MRNWIVASAIAVCGLLAAHEIVAARVTAHGPRRIAPQDYARSQQQVDQIERVARRLLESVPQPPPVQFILAAEEPSINAGATYGKVMVSSGMIEFLRSDDELALILGHELAHITQGHVSRGATNNALLSIGSTLASDPCGNNISDINPLRLSHPKWPALYGSRRNGVWQGLLLWPNLSRREIQNAPSSD